ncbi:MAG: hypothetical protein V7K38_14820 [Nostoc sp.]|uniref:hypothetical protein n=1 Tax=Nostoc sp. TaxID=1180 RepID=UPI002FF777C0
MSENFLVLYSRLVDPPKSPLKRGTLIPVPPFLRGARGDQAKYLQQIAIKRTTDKSTKINAGLCFRINFCGGFDKKLL